MRRDEDGYSFDPKTWVTGKADVTGPGERPASGGRILLATVSAAVLLLGAAAAAYLTRAPSAAMTSGAR